MRVGVLGPDRQDSSPSIEGNRVTSRSRPIRRGRIAAVACTLACALAIAGCGKGGGSNPANAPADAKNAAPAGTPAAGDPLLISAEDIVTVGTDALASGPSITGSVQPERRADLRAEVSALVMTVLKENGDPVRRGDLLVRLDDTSIRDSLTAAEASERAAVQALEQAERQLERTSKLRETNIVSTQQLEDTEVRRNAAQSEREAARTRVVTARQQLHRTEVRAPFDGIVSDRKVSAGDTAQIGKELLKVIDPTSLRFEGFVSADAIGEVKTGQRVSFRVHGYGERDFAGTIARVNPAANATTRQVEVLVDFPESGERPEVAGLYAEGRIESSSTSALTIPPTALVREGDATYTWRLEGRALQKVALRTGARDARTGAIAVQSGLAEGDRVLRYPNSTLHDGQSVEMTGPEQPSSVVQGGKPLATTAGK